MALYFPLRCTNPIIFFENGEFKINKCHFSATMLCYCVVTMALVYSKYAISISTLMAVAAVVNAVNVYCFHYLEMVCYFALLPHFSQIYNTLFYVFSFNSSFFRVPGFCFWFYLHLSFWLLLQFFPQNLIRNLSHREWKKTCFQKHCEIT